ncbi:hypothetical protein HEBU111660_06375 [Helicobacter burdigaliensis]
MHFLLLIATALSGVIVANTATNAYRKYHRIKRKKD